MAFIKNEMETTVREVNKYGFIIKYLISKNIITLEQFKCILLKSSVEERVLMFQKVLEEIKDEYYEEALSDISNAFSKSYCLKKFLKNSKDITDADEILMIDINILIDNKTYVDILNELSLQMLLEMLKEGSQTTFEKTIIDSYMILLENITRENNSNVKRNINGFYLRKVR